MRLTLESFPFLAVKGKNDSVDELFCECTQNMSNALCDVSDLEKGKIYKIKLVFELKEEK